MFNFFKKLFRKSDYIRGVLTLLTGTTVAQFIPVLLSPLITRLYSPEHFGILAIFSSISTILGSISNCRYELAIVLPEKDEDAVNITFLSMAIAFIFSLFLVFILFVFNKEITALVKTDAISFWLYFIPLIVFLIGMYNALHFYNLRKELYKNIAKSSIYEAVTLAIIQLGLGVLKMGVFGLIIGRFALRLAGNVILGKPLFKDMKQSNVITMQTMLKMSKRYSKFFKYSVWARLANTISLNLNNIFISNLYSTSDIGFYALTSRVLAKPSRLLGRSIGKVYYVKAIEEKNKTGNAKSTFKLSFTILFLVGIVVYGILFFTVENLFTFIFGEKWSTAGEYARIMMPLFFIRFLIAPLSNTNNVFEKQHISLMWQSGLLFITILVYILSKYFHFGIRQFLHLYTWFQFLHYIILGIIVYRLSRGKSFRKI